MLPGLTRLPIYSLLSATPRMNAGIHRGKEREGERERERGNQLLASTMLYARRASELRAGIQIQSLGGV